MVVPGLMDLVKADFELCTCYTCIWWFCNLLFRSFTFWKSFIFGSLFLIIRLSQSQSFKISHPWDTHLQVFHFQNPQNLKVPRLSNNIGVPTVPNSNFELLHSHEVHRQVLHFQSPQNLKQQFYTKSSQSLIYSQWGSPDSSKESRVWNYLAWDCSPIEYRAKLEARKSNQTRVSQRDAWFEDRA